MNYHQIYKSAYFFQYKLAFCSLLFILTGTLVASEVIKVEIIKNNDSYQLLRGGKSYVVKGAGLEFGDITSLASHGGNSIRNWSTTNDKAPAQELLDQALAHGVTVSLCLEMKLERWGFDYNDRDLVAAQFEKIHDEVLKYRNHPALLTWIIGNELNHSYSNAKVYDAVNDISKMIHELDPNHPTTTTLSGLDATVLNDVNTRATDLDFISFQVYGQLDILPKFIKQTGYTKPFMVTEWGAVGYWEMEKTSWGSSIEMNSSEKAQNYLRGYQIKLKSLEKQLLGSYAFLWGQKQERTPTWFGLFTETGEETEAVDVMHYIWNGNWPVNRSPTLVSMFLDSRPARQYISLKSGNHYEATVNAFDHEDDALSYLWEVKFESDANQVGGDFEEDIQSLSKLIDKPNAQKINIKTPSQAGAYRLFVYIYENQGHAAHANIPFYVSD